MIPTSQIRFRWTCSFMGCVEYEVTGDGPAYLLELRREASAYERSIFNGTEAEWQRDVVAAINVVRRKYDHQSPIDPKVVEAFNTWRVADHSNRLNDILTQPERYGVLAEDDPLRIAPPVVNGGHYVVGTGWVISERDPITAYSEDTAAESPCP